MILEFLGLPTSGKTTLSRAVSKELRTLGWSSVTLETLDAQDRDIRPVLRNNPIARTTYRLDRLRERHTEFFAYLDELTENFPVQRALILDCLIKQDLGRTMPEKVNLVKFDEGLWHRLAAIVSKRHDHDCYQLADIVPLAPAIGGLVFIASKPEETLSGSIERIDKRNKGKLSRETLEKRAVASHGTLEDLQLRLSLLQSVADTLEASGTRVVRLKARQSLSDMVNATMAQLSLPTKAGFFA